jgi:hypothetical protein
MLKKLLFKVALLVGLMLLVPYYLLGGGTMPKFLQDMFKTGKEVAAPLSNVSSVTTNEAVTLYKCKSETGQIEYSQSPCMGEGETIHLKPNVNIVQRTKIPEEEEEESTGGSVISLGSSDNQNNDDSDKKDKKGKKDKNDDDTDMGNPYDPDNIQKLIKDTKNIGKLMEQHNKQLDSISGQQK